MYMLLFQELPSAVSSGSESASMVTILLGLITTLLTAYTVTQKGRLDDMRVVNADLKAQVERCETRCERDVNAERTRVANAEKREDAAFDRLGTTVATVGDLSNALKDIAPVITATVQEIKKAGDRMEVVVRNQDDIKRCLNDIMYKRHHRDERE